MLFRVFVLMFFLGYFFFKMVVELYFNNELGVGIVMKSFYWIIFIVFYNNVF